MVGNCFKSAGPSVYFLFIIFVPLSMTRVSGSPNFAFQCFFSVVYA